MTRPPVVIDNTAVTVACGTNCGCTDADKHIADDPKEAELATCCADMDKHLAAAEAEHKKLMELLHIELPKPAAK